MKRIAYMILLLVVYSNAFLFDISIGQEWNLPMIGMDYKNYKSFEDRRYSYPATIGMIRLGINPKYDLETSKGDFNLFAEYSVQKSIITFSDDCWFASSCKEDLKVSTAIDNFGIGFGGSLPHAIVNFAFGVESYRSMGITSPYMRITLGGYISSTDKNSYKGILLETNLILSKHRFGASINIGWHFNGTKNYSYSEIKEKEEEEEKWLLIGAFAAVGTSSAAAAYHGGSSSYSSGTCKINGCRCKDGHMSFAEHRQGACSWHGGFAY